MTTKNQEVTNIIKISKPGDILLRRGSGNTIFLTKTRDDLVLDVAKRDVKSLYFDETAAQIFMTSPEYVKGIFPVNCDRGIEVLCGQDECEAYVAGESTPVSVLPPDPPIPPEGCPVPPCTPCPQQCDDGTCPPCTPPPQPCPCRGEFDGGLNPQGSVFPNCAPNPCGAACPCPGGGCPPCTGCPGNAALCDDGSCPPCGTCEDRGDCCDQPGSCPAAGSECCMCDRGGQCMSVTTFQFGYTTQSPRCPTGVDCDDDGNCVPSWEPRGPDETICTGDSCNCPCGDGNGNPCNAAKGSHKSELILCGQTTRTYCNGSTSTNTFTNPDGGTVILDFNTGLIDPSGLDFSSLPPAGDTIIEGEEGFADAPCGGFSIGGGAPCFCRCCVDPQGDCGGTPLCGGCPDDPPPAPPMESMCTSSGTSIIYRRMCAGGGMDYCAVQESGGDCQVNNGGCSAVPAVIISWYPNANVEVIADENGIVEGFDISLDGNPIGGPGAMGACNCNPGHGNGGAQQSGDFNDYYDIGSVFANPEWPSDNIAADCG